ncbi:hypothetical protein Pan44_03530 [Caulifigura coniformis]|uniref:Uncharacterized protein n=1 Tax=Caulifigura coniformis TaxID=2527983 RepID=A0A517S8A7_9PLAN|nr:hypothetical protein [Caulifigura coniformis]QDT52343.1 hypothetical protein Pan44_03530 [Caulifigura coniformis]
MKRPFFTKQPFAPVHLMVVIGGGAFGAILALALYQNWPNHPHRWVLLVCAIGQCIVVGAGLIVLPLLRREQNNSDDQRDVK